MSALDKTQWVADQTPRDVLRALLDDPDVRALLDQQTVVDGAWGRRTAADVLTRLLEDA